MANKRPDVHREIESGVLPADVVSTHNPDNWETDLTPEQPAHRIDEAVFGVDVGYHPVTGCALEAGSGAWPISLQAREHLKVIMQRDGYDAMLKVKAELEAFEAAGGAVELPPQAENVEFRKAARPSSRRWYPLRHAM
jgi:hypothetical protein